MVAEKVRDGEIKLPLLGICYGHQAIAHAYGSKVGRGAAAEYGTGEVDIDEEDLLFKGIPSKLRVWVSHFDEVKELPEGFMGLAHSRVCGIEAMRHKDRHIYGVQFHPEVWHTDHGEDILRNFLGISGHQEKQHGLPPQ